MGAFYGNTIDPVILVLIRLAGCGAVLLYVFFAADPVTAMGLKKPRSANVFYSLALAFFIYLPMSVLMAFLTEVMAKAGVAASASGLTQAMMKMPFWVELMYFCAIVLWWKRCC